MKVLVIGAGMYVTGREGTGEGVIMASLAQSSKHHLLEEVVVAAKSRTGDSNVHEAAARINGRLGTSLPFAYRVLDDERNVASQLPLDEFDCAVVSVPDHLHHRFAYELLDQSIPTLIVKPLTPTAAEARDLIEVQDRTETYAAVEFHKRWDPSNLLARRRIEEGKLGVPIYGLVEYSQRICIPAEIFDAWVNKTNIFQYLGVHYVDLFYYLTGFRPVRAMAVGARGALDSRGIDAFDSVLAHVIWEHSGGEFVSQFAIGWIDPNTTSAMSDQRVKIIGSAARLELDQKDRGIVFVDEDQGVQHVNPYFADFLPGDAGELEFQGYGHRSIETFIRDVQDLAQGKQSRAALDKLRPTLRQSLVSTAVVEAVNESLANNSEWREIDASV